VQDVGRAILITGDEALGPGCQAGIEILGMRPQIAREVVPLIGSILYRHLVGPAFQRE